MLKILLPLVVATLLVSGCAEQNAGTDGASAAATTTPSNTLSADSVLRHVVIVKFKDSTTPEQVRELEAAFERLPEQIDVVENMEWGTNVSPENLAQGYTHCFVFTFRDAAGRDEYLPHPDHKAFGSQIGPHIDQLLVVDFWAKNR